MNQSEKNTNALNHFQTALLSLITAGVIGMFVFLWDLNAKIAKMEERDSLKTETISGMQQSMNKLQLEMVDIKERMARIEARTK